MELLALEPETCRPLFDRCENYSIEKMVDLVGPEGILWGGGSSVVVTTGTPETIRADVRRRMEEARRLSGFFFALGGEAPQNVPTENVEACLAACREYGKRSG